MPISLQQIYDSLAEFYSPEQVRDYHGRWSSDAAGINDAKRREAAGQVGAIHAIKSAMMHRDAVLQRISGKVPPLKSQTGVGSLPSGLQVRNTIANKQAPAAITAAPPPPAKANNALYTTQTMSSVLKSGMANIKTPEEYDKLHGPKDYSEPSKAYKAEVAKQRVALVTSARVNGLLVPSPFAGGKYPDAEGGEHKVLFVNGTVIKETKNFGITYNNESKDWRYSMPTEYLDRVNLANKVFNQGIVVKGVTDMGTFVTETPYIKAPANGRATPDSSEISHYLGGLGFKPVDLGWNSGEYYNPQSHIRLSDCVGRNFMLDEQRNVHAVDIIPSHVPPAFRVGKIADIDRDYKAQGGKPAAPASIKDTLAEAKARQASNDARIGIGPNTRAAIDAANLVGRQDRIDARDIAEAKARDNQTTGPAIAKGWHEQEAREQIIEREKGIGVQDHKDAVGKIVRSRMDVADNKKIDDANAKIGDLMNKAHAGEAKEARDKWAADNKVIQDWADKRDAAAKVAADMQKAAQDAQDKAVNKVVNDAARARNKEVKLVDQLLKDNEAARVAKAAQQDVKEGKTDAVADAAKAWNDKVAARQAVAQAAKDQGKDENARAKAWNDRVADRAAAKKADKGINVIAKAPVDRAAEKKAAQDQMAGWRAKDAADRQARDAEVDARQKAEDAENRARGKAQDDHVKDFRDRIEKKKVRDGDPDAMQRAADAWNNRKKKFSNMAILTKLERLTNKLLFYSPDQARDDHGRWGDGASEAVVAKAKAFAQAAHAGQLRRVSNEPYFNHIQKVADLVKAHGGDPNQVAAAYLHDYDDINHATGREEINKEFGPDIGKLFDEVSKGFDKDNHPEMDKGQLHAAESDRLSKISGRGQDIKIGDVMDNGRDLMNQDPGRAPGFLGKNAVSLAGMNAGNPELKALAMKTLYGEKKLSAITSTLLSLQDVLWFYRPDQLRESGRFAPEGGAGATSTDKETSSSWANDGGPTRDDKGIALRGLRQLYTKCPAGKDEIDGIADKLAAQYGGKVCKAPIKGEERAMEKIMDDYKGDPNAIKDLVRNTIVVEDDQVKSVGEALRGLGANVKVIDGVKDPLGYSGVNTSMTLSNGLKGEIQVNSPEMIYAKSKEKEAKSLLGEEGFKLIQERCGMQCCAGHVFYEKWRSIPNPESSEAKAIAGESKAYYAKIKSATVRSAKSAPSYQPVYAQQ